MVKVNVTDPDGAKDTTTVTITVTNVEEDGKISLTWTRPQPGTDVEASLTDPDGSISSETWQWQISTNGNDWSNISEATSSTYTPQSGDVNKHLRAFASYTDPRGSGKTARSAAAYVKETPSSNGPPDFQVHTGGGYICNNDEGNVCLHVRRSAPAGSDIYYPASASDPNGDELRYSLDGSDKGLFSIDSSRGTLFTTEAHAYNDPGQDGIFEITIIATDPSGLSGRINVALRPSGSSGAPCRKGPRGHHISRRTAPGR